MNHRVQLAKQTNRPPAQNVADLRRILVVEDDADISHLLEIHLRDNAFQVDVVNNGIDGLNRASNHPYNLIVLDLMLPGLDGLEICRRLRQQSVSVPILMLTAKSSELDRVLGLELGADDYLTKPFSILDKAVDLTAREFDLLLYFAQNPGRVFSRGQLLDQVWGYSHCGYEHTVNSHINRLRKKIESDGEEYQFIETVWGVGYRFREA